MTGGHQQLCAGLAGPIFGVFEVTDDDLVARHVDEVVGGGRGDGGDDPAASLRDQRANAGKHVGFERERHPAARQDPGRVQEAVGEP